MGKDAFKQEPPRQPSFTDILFKYHPLLARPKELDPACTPIIKIHDKNNNEKIRPSDYNKSAKAKKSKEAETASNIRPRQLSSIFQLPSGPFVSEDKLAELSRVNRIVDYFTTVGKQSQTKQYLQLLKEKILDPLYCNSDQLNMIHYPNKEQQKFLEDHSVFLNFIETSFKKIFITHCYETDDTLLTTTHETLSKFLHAYKYFINNINIDFMAFVESLKADFFKKLNSQNFLDIEKTIFKNAQEELNLQIKKEKYNQNHLKKGKEKEIFEAEQTLEKIRNLEIQRDTVFEVMQAALTYGDLSEILRDTTHNLQISAREENQHTQASHRYASWKWQLLGGALLTLSAALFVLGGLVMGLNPGAGGAMLLAGVYSATSGIGFLYNSRQKHASRCTQKPERALPEPVFLTSKP